MKTLPFPPDSGKAAVVLPAPPMPTLLPTTYEESEEPPGRVLVIAVPELPATV